MVVVIGFLLKNIVLLALSLYRGLIRAENFVGLRDGKLFNGDVGTFGVLDDDGGPMFAMLEEGCACIGEVEAHRLVGALGGFEGTAGGPEDIMPELGIVCAS